MRRVRRTVFAAAWLVAGCSSAARNERRLEPRVAMAPPDAGPTHALGSRDPAPPPPPAPPLRSCGGDRPCVISPPHYGIVAVGTVEGGVEITIGVGSKGGITTAWTGMLDGVSADRFAISDVRELLCKATVHVAIDDLKHGPLTVTLAPPP